MDAISAQLEALGVDGSVLSAHLGIVAESLGDAERQLWTEGIVLSLDSMNIQREADDLSARQVVLQELHNARRRHVVVLPISLSPIELPPRQDFAAAAQRYL